MQSPALRAPLQGGFPSFRKALGVMLAGAGITLRFSSSFPLLSPFHPMTDTIMNNRDSKKRSEDSNAATPEKKKHRMKASAGEDQKHSDALKRDGESIIAIS